MDARNIELMIFTFKDLELAKVFATAVKLLYQLDGRVFDKVDDAERAPVFPFLTPPVVHIDRPIWLVEPEAKIEKLAGMMGGKFFG